MRLLDIAFKDILQILRDWKSAIFLVLMPLMFTVFFGFMLRGAEADPRAPVGIINQDSGGKLAGRLQQWFEDSGLVKVQSLTGQDAAKADALVRDERLLAVLIIPQGFSERALAGDSIPAEIIVKNGLPAGMAASSLLQSGVKRLLGSVESALLSAEATSARQPFADEAARGAFINQALERALAEWQQPPLSVAAQPAAGALAAKTQAPSGFLQSSPGMLVQFSIFTLITSAMVLVLERKTRTLQRLLVAPISPAGVVAGHLLAMFLVVFFQQVLLIAVGQIFFQVTYLQQPLATLLLMVALSLWVCSLGLLISAWAKSEERVILASLIAMFVFAIFGGAWFPLELAGKAFIAIGHAAPTAWAMDGFQNIVLRGLGLNSVLLPAGILLAYAAVFFGAAVWRFRFD
jgi:ABC-type multidrug transport system permease subunit